MTQQAQSGPTPEQWAEIERVAADFDKDWEFYSKKLQIRRKPRSWLQKVGEFIKPPKHTVFALYWWIKINYSELRMLDMPYPIQSDNMPVKGYPVKYELQGGWSIPDEDLKYLHKGPLMSQGLQKMLVPWDAGVAKIKRLAREWGPVIGIFGSIAAIIRLFL